jgi:hypothetical protein
VYHCEETNGEEGHLYITSNHLGFATKEEDVQHKKLVHLLDVMTASAVRVEDEKEARCVEVTLADDSVCFSFQCSCIEMLFRWVVSPINFI